jgi:hypothetical protein
MTKAPVPGDLLDTYEVQGADTRNGLVILGVATAASFLLSIYLVSVSDLVGGITLFFLSIALLVVFAKAFKRFRSKTCYGFTAHEFFMWNQDQTLAHPLNEIASIELSSFGAGESSPGSYKLNFSDGVTYWFHAFGRAAEFVNHLSKISGIGID